MRGISSSNVGIRVPALLTSAKTTTFRPIYWLDGRVRLIDQTRLPMEPSGDAIPIEERPADDVTHQVGVVGEPYEAGLRRIMEAQRG